MAGTYSRTYKVSETVNGTVGTYSRDFRGVKVDNETTVGSYSVYYPGDTVSGGGGSTPTLYSIASTFISDANETFTSTTYSNISGVTNKAISLTSGVEYGIIMNGSMKTDSGADTIWGVGLNFDDGTQVVDVGTFRLDHGDAESWESFTLMNKFTASSDLTAHRVQVKQNSGTGVIASGGNREWGVYIFELSEDFVIPQLATSTGTWSDSSWHDVPGTSTGTIDITSGENYVALMGLKHYQSSGAPDVTSRVDFNAGTQTIAGYRSWDGVRNEHDHFLESFTASADLTAAKFQVQRSNGTGTYELISGMQQDLALIPLDANSQYFEWTQSSTQDTTSATYIDLNGVTDTACSLTSGQNYVAIINCFCAGNISGGGDVRFGMNFDNGTEVIDAGFIEVQATEARQLESAMHVVPFTPTGDHTTIRLQAKRIAGTVTLRFNGTYNYQMLIRKVN